MPNYSKAIVYKLCCKDVQITDIYIGSTCNFSKRKNAHKTDCNNEKSEKYNLKLYQFIRQNGGFGNWSIIQIEAYECNNKRELEQYERYHIEKLKPALNHQIPTRTDKEYRDQNKEQKKEYYEQNKEIIAEKRKDYYEENKDKIKEKIKEKIVCDCGSEVTIGNLSRHQRSKKHLSSV
jgi:hypothetical protein